MNETILRGLNAYQAEVTCYDIPKVWINNTYTHTLTSSVSGSVIQVLLI